MPEEKSSSVGEARARMFTDLVERRAGRLHGERPDAPQCRPQYGRQALVLALQRPTEEGNSNVRLIWAVD